MNRRRNLHARAVGVTLMGIDHKTSSPVARRASLNSTLAQTERKKSPLSYPIEIPPRSISVLDNVDPQAKESNRLRELKLMEERKFPAILIPLPISA